MSSPPTMYPNLSQELGINVSKKHYNVPIDNVDVALNAPGLTPNELNSSFYKNDFKSIILQSNTDIVHSMVLRNLCTISVSSLKFFNIAFSN